MGKLLPSRFYILDSGRGGQSLLELLIAVTLGALLIVAAATIIVPALKINTKTTQVQAATALGKELLDNVRVWSEEDWHNISALATTSANLFYLNASTSPFTSSTGVETVTVSTTTYKRFFYVDSVSRNSGAPYNIVTSGGVDDPSTKKITVGFNWPQGATSTIYAYLTRNRDNIYNQTDWSGGPGLDGPVSSSVSRFSTSTNADYSTSSGSLYIKLP